MVKNRVLLLGAGFSRNWGGWLASEITYRLLEVINNAPPMVIREYYKQLATGAGNYETILQEFQGLHSADLFEIILGEDAANQVKGVNARRRAL